jgi:hypothetical protein
MMAGDTRPASFWSVSISGMVKKLQCPLAHPCKSSKTEKKKQIKNKKHDDDFTYAVLCHQGPQTPQSFRNLLFFLK